MDTAIVLILNLYIEMYVKTNIFNKELPCNSQLLTSKHSAQYFYVLIHELKKNHSY